LVLHNQSVVQYDHHFRQIANLTQKLQKMVLDLPTFINMIVLIYFSRVTELLCSRYV